MLKGRNITLRLVADDDLDEMAALLANITDRGEYYPISLRSLTDMRRKVAETGWWENEQGQMLITGGDGTRLGHIFYFLADKYRGVHEIGYSIFRPADRGKGIMSAALRIFSAYLFEIKPIPRLELLIDVNNAASRRVAEKCGYRHEGVLRQYIFMRGEYHDCDALSLLRGECCFAGRGAERLTGNCEASSIRFGLPGSYPKTSLPSGETSGEGCVCRGIRPSPNPSLSGRVGNGIASTLSTGTTPGRPLSRAVTAVSARSGRSAADTSYPDQTR